MHEPGPEGNQAAFFSLPWIVSKQALVVLRSWLQWVGPCSQLQSDPELKHVRCVHGKTQKTGYRRHSTNLPASTIMK